MRNCFLIISVDCEPRRIRSRTVNELCVDYVQRWMSPREETALLTFSADSRLVAPPKLLMLQHQGMEARVGIGQISPPLQIKYA